MRFAQLLLSVPEKVLEVTFLWESDWVTMHAAG
jgi:hypothetical protein